MVVVLTPTAFAWELERPSDDILISQRTENSATDGKVSVGLGVDIHKYYEDDPDFPAWGDDYVKLRISATGNTRKIISYDVYDDYYSWHDKSELLYEIDLYDDEVVDIYPPFKVRFYGGPGSAEYDAVWLSSNGFLVFYDPLGFTPDPSPYYHGSIPSRVGPDNFVAPFWRDLKPNEGGKIKYGTVWHRPGFGPYIECFAVSWINVPDKDGNLQTFQVLLEKAPSWSSKHRQSRIWFQYKSITLTDQTTVGVEDQQGARGTSYNYQDLDNEMTLKFEQASNSAFINTLKITLSESEADARTVIDLTPESIRGYNVILEEDLPDEDERYLLALEGWLTLLAYASGTTGAGILVDIGFITIGFARYFARQQAKAQLFSSDCYTYATAHAVDDPEGIFISNAVDASFDILVFWVLTDPQNDQDHDLTVTAELQYYEYDPDRTIVATPTITTSVDLKLTREVGDDIDDPKEVVLDTYYYAYVGASDEADFYTAHVPSGKFIHTWIIFESGDNRDFDLYLYDPNNQLRAWSNRTIPIESITLTADITGYWFVEVRWRSGRGIYKFMFSLEEPPPSNGGGGGCPYVSTWDGTRWWLDNNLMPAAEHSNGTDVIDYYKLQQPLVLNDDGTYCLLLSEFEQEHDFFDQVKLLAVDHEPSVGVAVSPYGEILTYTEPSPPLSAIDSNNRNVKHTLGTIDENYYEGYNGSYITLNFGDELDVSNGAKLVMRADGPHKYSIYVQVQKDSGDWNTVATLIPRMYWATEIIDMSEHLPDAKGNLKIRLYFTANHKLDFVGLDTSPQTTIHVPQGQLISAIHSVDGDVTSPLLYSDDTSVELLPEQQIELKFALPQQIIETRDYIIIIEGHYYTIKI